MSGELGGTPSRRLTHQQAVEIALNDPAARQAAAQTPLAARRRQLYAQGAADILDESAVAGFPGIDTVGELYQRRLDYRSAVPILLEWLPKASYLMLSIDIVCALSASFAKKLAVPEFLRLFREPPPVQDPLRPATSPPPAEELRWFIAGGLGGFAGPPVADELIELALNRRFGWARYQIVEALPKTKDERVAEVLLGLLDDPTVRAAAVAALGKMKYTAARESIEVLLADPDKNVRNQAKKALKRIDSQL